MPTENAATAASAAAAFSPEAPFLIDSHCHLDLAHFDDDRDDVMAHAAAAGVRFVINPGIDLEHSRAAIALAERYPQVYAAVGVHPNRSDRVGTKTIEALRKLAEHPKVVAIGEIGLDYYWDKVAPAQQANAFRAQLDLATEVGLPVIIHSRESNADVAAILSAWAQSDVVRQSKLAAQPYYGVLHAYSGDLALAEEAYQWNFVLSLGGPVTFKNAKALHALVPQLRLDRLMLETDAPFLTPHPHRGTRNEPSHVALVCARLAELYNVTSTEIAETTSALAMRFFGLEEKALDR